MTATRCKGCGAEIIWALVTNPGGGTVRVPLNATRVRTYRVTAELGDQVDAEPVLDAFGQPALGYVSHFVSCPKRQSFSRSKA